MRPETWEIVGAWLAYTQVEEVASLDPDRQTELRAKFRWIVERTWQILDGVQLPESDRRILLDFSRLLLRIVEREQAWWDYNILMRELGTDPKLRVYRSYLANLLDYSPSPHNAIYWARQLAQSLKGGIKR